MIYLIMAVGVYGLIVSDNLIKKIMCLNVVESSIILIFLRAGYVRGMLAPIIGSGDQTNFVNPIPQALMLTAIVISVCFNALAIIMIVKLYEKKGSVEVSTLNV